MRRIVSRSARAVRSGLIGFQLPPRSVDLKRTFAAEYTTPGVTVENSTGVSQPQRYDGSFPNPRGTPAGPPVLAAGPKQETGRPTPGFALSCWSVARLIR